MASELETKVEKLSTNIERVDQFTNGDETTIVEVDGGRQVPSLTRAVYTLLGTVPVEGYPTEAELLADLSPGPKAVAIAGDTERMFIKAGERGSGRWDPTSGTLFGRLINLARPLLVTLPKPWLLDRYGWFGALEPTEFRKSYWPQPTTVHQGDRKIIRQVLGPASDDLADYAEVEYSTDTPTLIYIDLDTTSYKSALLAGAGWTTVNLDRIVPLAIIDGDNVTTTLEFRDIWESDRIAFVPGDPIIVSARQGKMYVPAFRWSQGSARTTWSPPNGDRYVEVAINTTPQDPLIHYFDPASSTIKTTGVQFPYLPDFGETVLARSWSSRITSDFPYISDVEGGFSLNLIPNGNRPSLAPRVGSANMVEVDIVDQALKDRGFAKGLRNTVDANKASHVGDGMPDLRPGQRAFARVYVESTEDNPFAPNVVIARALFWETAASQPVSVTLRFEKRLSARSAIFSASFEVPDNASHRWVRYAVGAWVNGVQTFNITVTGQQFHAGDGRGAWIAHEDYPLDPALPARVAAIEAVVIDVTPDMLIPTDLWLVDKRPVQLYPGNLMPKRSSGAGWVCSAAAVDGGAYALPVSIPSNGSAIDIDPSRFRTTGAGVAVIEGRKHSDTAANAIRPWRHFKKDVSWHVAPSSFAQGVTDGKFVAGQNGLKVLFLADSIGNNNFAHYTRLKLSGYGFAATFVGTVDNPDTSGTKGECRPGKRMIHYTNQSATFGPVPVGGEAAYLALPNAQRMDKLPWLRIATADDPADRVFNGYIADFRFYLDRFSFPDPDFVMIPMLTNDILGAVPLADMKTALDVIVRQLRKALPNAEIGIGIPTPARRGGNPGDALWETGWAPVIRYLLSYPALLGDAKVKVVPLWAHLSSEAGFPLAAVSTDAQTGVVDADLSDPIHPDQIGRHQLAEQALAWIACRKAGV